jgi:hypothetical protein
LATATLGTSFNVLSGAPFTTAGAINYKDTGLSITLPTSGAYLLAYDINVSITNGGSDCAGYAVLFDSTASGYINGTYTRPLHVTPGVNTVSGFTNEGNAAATVAYQTALNSGHVIKLLAALDTTLPVKLYNVTGGGGPTGGPTVLTYSLQR